jgi:UDP:flavonoid glycosyltransferase YjiC (YdhE family)
LECRTRWIAAPAALLYDSATMCITILALGSRGDVQPLIALGQALQAAGHRVRLATFAAFAEAVRQAGLDFFALEGDAHLLLGAAISAGPAAIPFPKLTVGNLAAAIDQAVSDLAMKQRARALGQQLVAQRGLERAVTITTGLGG